MLSAQDGDGNSFFKTPLPNVQFIKLLSQLQTTMYRARTSIAGHCWLVQLLPFQVVPVGGGRGVGVLGGTKGFVLPSLGFPSLQL